LADRNLDLKKAVTCFLDNFENLSCLPFLTDSEAERLYGPEVAAALAELDDYNRREKICRSCRSRCCLRVKCEFYSPDLLGCPVYSFRPALCRVHFCDKYAQKYPNLVKEIGDIFLEGLVEAARINKRQAGLFDCPAWRPVAPSRVSSISAYLEKVREGSLDEVTACRLIQEEIVAYNKV